MFQDELFSNSKDTFQLNEGSVCLHKNVFSYDKSLVIFEALKEELNWQQDEIKMFGKRIPIPRMNAWYADVGCNYKYSGIQLEHNLWSPTLNIIRNKIKELYDISFNSCLANFYRNGQDSVGWHSDDEPELGKNPTIFSISFGEERKFQIRNKNDYKDRLNIPLTHNSLLIMKGSLQHIYEHQVPKEPKKQNPRVNLTFRNVY